MNENQEAVTVAITHHLKPGREMDFERWVSGVRDHAAGFAGFQGYVILPHEEGSLERRAALRFDSVERMNAYWATSENQARRAKLLDLVTEPSEVHPEVGIEHWFMSPDGPGPPSRHRMAVAVFVAILPLVTFLPPRITPWLSNHVPTWMVGVITTALMVLIMTYIAMPIVTRLMRAWLQPMPNSRRG